MKKAIRLAPTKDTLRALFAHSGNKCAFPGCSQELINDKNIFIAQVCHIEAAEEEGQRFNPQQTDEERRAYDNLIILCYPHHIITNNVKEYPVHLLKKIKLEHENKSRGTSFKVNESIIDSAFNDLKEKANKILRNTEESLRILNKFENFIYDNENLKKNKLTNGYDVLIEEIKKTREKGSPQIALNQYLKLRKNKWKNLTKIQKYHISVNIGLCYLELFKNDLALKYFIECIKYNSTTDKALAFIALGYAIKGDAKKAKSYIDKSLSKNKKNINAYLALITISKDNNTLEEIINKIPLKLQRLPEIAYTLGQISKQKNNIDEAIRWTQIAVDKSKTKKEYLKFSLAALILESSVSNKYKLYTNQTSEEILRKIKYAIQLITEGWNQIKDTELRSTYSWSLVNRGVAKRIIKDYDGAMDDFKEACNIKSNYYNLRNLAVAYFEIHNSDKALEVLDKLKKITPKNSIYELELFKSIIYYTKQDYSKAINILLKLSNKKSRKKFEEDINNLLGTCYLFNNENEKAEKLILSSIKRNPKSIISHLNAYRYYKKIGNKTESDTYFTKAFESIKADSNPIDLQELANEFYNLGDFKNAYQIYEKITSTNVYSPLTQLLLKSLLNQSL